MRSLIQRQQSLKVPTIFLYILLSLGLGTISANAGNQLMAWGAGTNVSSSDNNVQGQSIVPSSLTNAVLVAGGWRHSLALRADHTLLGWGDNYFDQTTFPAGGNYISIACGYLFSVALQSNGTVVATGDFDTYGETDVPVNLSNVVAVACGWFHGLALKNDGTVVSWGTDTNPADFGSDNVSYGQSLVPASLSNVVAVAGGAYHSLALKADGTLSVWGRNNYSQATIPAGVSNVVAIAAAAGGNLVLEANGKLVAWGDNEYGQTNIPANLTNVVAIAAGGWHYLALKSDGTITAWGAVTNGGVNYGQTNVPSGLKNVVQVAAGLFHSLALVGSAPPALTAVLTSAAAGTNGFTAKMATRNGRVYRLEYNNNLTNQTWSAFPLQAGTGTTNQFVDPNPSAPQRFYRVSRW